jgi:FMN phosphatase YigB (HAD superfamily)
MANFSPPGFEDTSNILAIDFDGVLHNADKGWGDGTCYGEPLPGAIEAVKQLSNKYKIIIFTAKAKPDRPLVEGKTGTQLVQEWFERYDILSCIDSITSEKPRAELYIDDNGYRFTNWNNTLSFIKNTL